MFSCPPAIQSIYSTKFNVFNKLAVNSYMKKQYSHITNYKNK